MDLSTLTAVILAGGLGTRLRSVAPAGPKALAPVLGRPFLEYQIEWLTRQGVPRVVLCLGYASQAIIEHVGDGSRFGVDVIYSVETEPLGTAGALALARPYVPSTALALNGDTFYADDLAPMVAQHRTCKAALTIGASRAGDRSASGQIVADDSQRVLHFTEKSAAIHDAWVSAGLYLLQPAILDAIPTDRAVSLENETLPQLLAEQGAVYIYPLRRGFWDMGTPDGFARLNDYLSSQVESAS